MKDWGKILIDARVTSQAEVERVTAA